jgi:O-antigen ligase
VIAEAFPTELAGNASLTGRRDARLRNRVLLQTVVCIGPSMLAVAAAQPVHGARWLFATTVLFLGTNFVARTPESGIALLVALLPALSIFKGLVMWNALSFLFAVGTGAVLLQSPTNWRVVNRPMVVWLVYSTAVYWLVSFMLTGDYSRNLRAMEAAFAAVAMLLLVSHRQQLAGALLGSILTLWAVGLAMLPHSDRLGMANIAGIHLGNPITYGVPCALAFVLVNAEAGKWLLLQRRLVTRVLLSVTLGVLLLLSTSRASWLVTAVSLVVILVVNRASRRMALASVAVLGIATAGVLQTKETGAHLAKGFERTFSEKRSVLQKTSGRSDQWMLFPRVMEDAPLWGFGPGSGTQVYARYSALDPRIRYRRGGEAPWHSLYLHVAVETGVVGSVALLVLFTAMLASNVRSWRERREITPFLGTVGFLIIALTVSGMDAASGLFLGLGLLTPSPLPRPVPEPEYAAATAAVLRWKQSP